MTKIPTELQSNILRLAQTRNLSEMTYREIALLVGASHPYSAQQAINRLTEKGLIVKNRITNSVFSPGDSSSGSRPLLNIPVMGRVNCGPASEMVSGNASGFIALSPSVAKIRKPQQTYALMAVGDSMSAACIHGKTVDDGDYVIVEKSEWGEAQDGDYVVSRFDDMNNLKRLQIDNANNRVILNSESHQTLPPIIIASEDMSYYAIEGVAIDVVKGMPA